MPGAPLVWLGFGLVCGRRSAVADADGVTCKNERVDYRERACARRLFVIASGLLVAYRLSNVQAYMFTHIINYCSIRLCL